MVRAKRIRAPWAVRLVSARTAKYYGHLPAELRATGVRGETGSVVRARQVAMWLAYERTAASYAEIARHFGVDRSSVSHSVAKIGRLLADHPQCALTESVTALITKLDLKERADG